MVIAYRGKRWLYLAQRLVGDECADYIPRSFCWPQEVVGVKPPSGRLRGQGVQGDHRQIQNGCQTAGPTLPDGRAGRMVIVGPGAGMDGVPRSLG